MKKLWIPLFAILAFTCTANAQEKMGKMGKKGHHRQHDKGMMAKQLNFTEDQKKQARTINEDFRKKMQELNKNENITVKEMRDRKAVLHKEKKTKLDGLLTADQKTKLTQLKAEQKIKNDEQFAKKLNKMKGNLDLTETQVTKIKAQREITQSKMKAIRDNESLTREQRREKMIAIKVEAKDQHQKIFTPDQLKKMEELKKKKMERPPAR